MMVEYGELFWRDGWGSLYSVFGGNPLAAMPSLHFATSVMAALLLAEVGPVAGALGFGYAATLGFALVYLGEHYAVDLLGGAALTAARAPAGAARGAGARAHGARGRGAGGDGPRGGLSRGGEHDEHGMRSSEARRAGRPRSVEAADAAVPRARAPSAGEEEMPRVRLTRRQVVAFAAFILLGVGFLYFVLPNLAGVGTTVHHIEGGDKWWIAVGVVLEVLSFAGYVVLFRAVFVHAGDSPSGSAGARATRSRWPASSPRACSPPPAPAASR